MAAMRDGAAGLGFQLEELPPRFAVQRSLSAGRYKHVILARDELVDRDVAISVIEAAADAEMRSHALQEIRVAALLGRKPNIATVYDVIETAQHLFVVCEFFPGGTLADLLNRYDLRRLPLERALRIAIDICTALAYVHDEGVVHRDLKTSNLMFDEVGNVHLSDFGTSGVAYEYALDEDRSSFGSPAYMAPEQIRGEPADIRTDLYALGCVIYETLSGSVPFAGSTEQTIAGHLAKAPAALASVREDVPSSLSELVHALLEKDKSDRPGTVDEVKATLEASLERIAHESTAEVQSTRFVGRGDELARIDTALESAAKGETRALLVEGPPGIGKSRLLDLSLEHARAASMNTLLGRCSIDGEDPHACLRAAFAPVWMPPEGDEFSGEGMQSHFAEDREQWIQRLIDDLLTYAQTHGALLLAIENLHWANQLTLSVVTQLLRRLQSRLVTAPRILLLLTARPMETHTPPLLDEIINHSEVVQLGGLAADEIRAWAEDQAQARPTRALLTLLAQASGGNPLFLAEVFRILEIRGDLTRDGIRVDLRERTSEIELPTTPLEAFSRNYQQLSSSARRVHMFASFLGESFDVATLARVVSLSLSGVRELLEEGLASGLLSRQGETYTFRHALARQAIYALPAALRKQTLHAQIIDRLEKSKGDPMDASILARHYIGAGTRVDPLRAVQCAEEAGDRSWAAYDFEGAARYYEAAAKAAERGPEIQPEKEAQLHFKAGFAFARGYDLRVSTNHYRIAAGLYEQLGNRVERVRALNDIVRNEFSSGEIAPGQLAHVEELECQLNELERSTLRAEVLDTLASAYVHARRYERGAMLSAEALTIANESKDHGLLAHLYGSVGLCKFEQFRLVEALDAWKGVEEHGRLAGSSLYIARGLQRQPLALFLLGHVEQAKEVIARASQASKETNNIGELSLVLSAEVAVDTLLGKLDPAQRAARQALNIIESTRYPWAAPFLVPALASCRAAAGDAAGALAALSLLETDSRVFEDTSPYRAAMGRLRKLVHAMHAPTDRMRDDLARTEMKFDSHRVTLQGVSRACVYVELASWLDATELASQSYEYLLAAQSRGLVISSGWVFLLPRMIGVAALLNHDPSVASLALNDAMRIAERSRALPEYARAVFDHARALRAAGAPSDRWRMDLHRAHDMFKRLKMPFDLARAQRFETACD